MKKMLSILLASTMALSAVAGLVACGGDDDAGGDPNPNVITVWAPDASVSTYETLISEFKADPANAEYTSFEYRVIAKGEGDVAGAMGTTPIKGAEVFFFASDHYQGMRMNNYLQPLTTEYETAVKGRDVQSTYEYVTADDQKIYAFPTTNDNGYFLWYDSEFYTETEVLTLTAMQDKARTNSKRIMFDYSNSWYTPAFLIGAGCHFGYTDQDMKHYRADLSGTTAENVVKAMVSYGSAAKNTFTVAGRDDPQQVITTGNLSSGLAARYEVDKGENGTAAVDQYVAGFSGTWELGSIQNAMAQAMKAKDYSKLTEAEKTEVDANVAKIKCTKMPTYTCAGEEVQLGSFLGAKYCGVNRSKSEAKIKASLALANYFTGAHGQEARYDATGAGPTNTTVAALSKVQNDRVLAAFKAQSDTNKNLIQGAQSDAFWGDSGIKTLGNQIFNRVITTETAALSALTALNSGLNT